MPFDAISYALAKKALTKASKPKLTELEIDVDKDWNSKSITNANIVDARSFRISNTEIVDSSRNLKNIASVAQALLPDTDNTRDLGSSSLRWRCAYFGSNIYWGKSQLSIDQGGAIELGDSLTSGVTPFIDFHYGIGSSEDFNIRIINNANRQLSIISPVAGGVLRLSNMSLNIGGYDVITDDRILKNLRVSCLNKGGTDVSVTETSWTLKQTISPDSGFYGFPYIEGIRVVANNPSGSGVTLYFQLRALLDDNSEVNLHDPVSVSAGSSFSDWLRFIMENISHEKAIKAIRLYAYVSATPTTAPTIRIDKVTGVMV